MTKYLSIIFAALLVFAFLPACNGNGGEGDADQEVTPDQPTEDVIHEDITAEELPGDPPAEDQPTEDVTPDTPVDTPEEETPACPPDDADHIYINVDGTAQSLDTTSVEGINVAPISPLDALTNPTPVHLDDATVAADGSFAFDCLNVDGVTLGLVILADDTGAGTDWYPTGTGVKAWTTDAEKTDITGATIFAVTETTAAGIEALTSMDFDTTGVVMGLVVDATTGDPIDGAEVVRADATALAVDYPNATMTGLESDGNTSALGAFVVTEELTLVTGTLTVNATGYTFGDHPSATKDGFIYFMIVPGTPD